MCGYCPVLLEIVIPRFLSVSPFQFPFFVYTPLMYIIALSLGFTCGVCLCVTCGVMLFELVRSCCFVVLSSYLWPNKLILTYMYTVFYILYVIWYILNSLQLRIRRVRILFSRKTLSGNYRVSWLFSEIRMFSYTNPKYD